MSEQNIKQEESIDSASEKNYIDDHPDAIEDVDLASITAHATKLDEERMRRLAQNAIDFAKQDSLEQANIILSKMEEVKKTINERAERISSVYLEAKRIINGE